MQKATVCECSNGFQYKDLTFPVREQELRRFCTKFCFKVLPMLENRYTMYFTTVHGMNRTASEQHSGIVAFLHSRFYL